MQWFPVAKTTDIPKNEGRKVSFQAYELAVFNVAGEFLAIDTLCPHKQGPLADGIVSGQSVFCPLHNLKIDLKNGLADGGSCVKTYPVKVIAGKICVAFHEGHLCREVSKDAEFKLDERH